MSATPTSEAPAPSGAVEDSPVEDQRILEVRDRIAAAYRRAVERGASGGISYYGAYRPGRYYRPDRSKLSRRVVAAAERGALVLALAGVIGSSVVTHNPLPFLIAAGPSILLLVCAHFERTRVTFAARYQVTDMYLDMFADAQRLARAAGKRNTAAAQIAAEIVKLGAGFVQLAIVHDAALYLALHPDRHIHRPTGLTTRKQLWGNVDTIEYQIEDVLAQVIVAQWVAQAHADGTFAQIAHPAQLTTLSALPGDLPEQMRVSLERLAELRK